MTAVNQAAASPDIEQLLRTNPGLPTPTPGDVCPHQSRLELELSSVIEFGSISRHQSKALGLGQFGLISRFKFKQLSVLRFGPITGLQLLYKQHSPYTSEVVC